MKCTLRLISVLLASSLLHAVASAQTEYFEVAGTKKVVSVHSPGLEGNLLGDSPDQSMTVYLPPGYENSPGNLYPVIYFLHGILGDHNTFFGGAGKAYDFQLILDRLINTEAVPPVILVAPSSHNKYRGSFYTNSYVTGQWEDFIVKDVVQYMDENYRTIASREGRGLAGHSMGGYGTLKLAMRHPSLFSAAYALSPYGCVMKEEVLDEEFSAVVDASKSNDFSSLSTWAMSMVMQAAAFAPDTTALPWLGSLPVTDTGEPSDSIWERWAAHDLSAMLPLYKDSLLKLSAIQYDCGNVDEYGFFPYCERFSDSLSQHGVSHIFEAYEGDHGNRLPERMENRLLPFFQTYLENMIPGIKLLSEAYLSPTDTLKVALDRKGWACIVPSPTPAVPDSILDRQLFFAEVDGSVTLQVPLAELEDGKYFIYGLSEDSSSVSIPLPFGVDSKMGIPTINVLKESVVQGDTLYMACDKNSTIYLVIPGTTPEYLSQTSRVKATIEVSAGILAGIPTAGIYPKSYLLLAEDLFGNFSEPVNVRIEADATAVRDLRKTCSIYPNPVRNYLYIDTGQQGTWNVQISSVSGQQQFASFFHGTRYKIDLTNLSKGAYFIHIRSDEQAQTSKIIKL